MHMAKHSFTNFVIKSNTGILMISILLGHTKLSTSQLYLKDFCHKKEADKMRRLFG